MGRERKRRHCCLLPKHRPGHETGNKLGVISQDKRWSVFSVNGSSSTVKRCVTPHVHEDDIMEKLGRGGAEEMAALEDKDGKTEASGR